MAFLQYLHAFLSPTILISLYIYFRLRSSTPTNWPILGMSPAILWNFHNFNDYISHILNKNQGTFLYKGPWFSKSDILFTSDPANFHHISTTNFQNYPKGPVFQEIFDILGDGIFNCDSNLWELQRATTILLFKRPDFLEMFKNIVWHNVEEKLMPVLGHISARGSKMDLQRIFQILTFDVTMNLLFDYDPKALPVNNFEEAFMKAEEALLKRYIVPRSCWRLLKRFQIGNEIHLSNAANLSDEIFYKFIQEKQENITKCNDVEDFRLLTGFMREYKDQNGSFGKPKKFIKDTLLSLLVAGRDTTSSALTWFFYLIAKNPFAERKILEEITEQLGTKEGEKWRRFGTNELEKLVYLQGAICEALRLFPPVPLNPKLSLEADTMPSGHRVRKNTKIVLNSYATGRMEKVWGQDCLEFKPERWLLEKGRFKHVPSHKFNVFHTGPRSCLGKKMSLLEMKIVVATIIYHYKVEMVEGHSIAQNTSAILQMKYGLMVKLIRR